MKATLTRRFVPGAAAVLFATAAACRVWAPTTDMDVAAAEQFVKGVNDTLGRLDVVEQQTGWIAATYITTDTEAVAARASQALLEAALAVRQGSREVQRRDRVAGRRAAPTRSAETGARACDAVGSERSGGADDDCRAPDSRATYGKGKLVRGPLGRRPIHASTSSRSPKSWRPLATRKGTGRREAWEGWHTISKPMKPRLRAVCEARQ